MNTLLFDVTIIEQGEIEPGYVGVIVSNVGEELANQPETPTKISEMPDLGQPVHELMEVVLQTDMNKRGIIKNPVAAGKYNLNTLAYRVIKVPTSAVTIDWGTEQKNRETEILSGGRSDRLPVAKIICDTVGDFFRFGQLLVTSQDGFLLKVDVRLIIRISAEHASFVIARFGSVVNLIEQIAHPLIDASFRNNAGSKKALTFVQERTKLQEDALEQAIKEFKKYHIEVQKLLISFIGVDQGLLDTQTKKEIAAQQIEQFEKEAEAQTAKAKFEEQQATANKQKELVAAKLGITIATDNADIARKTADGKRDARMAEAAGDAEYIQKTGEAKGAEPRAVGLANAEAYAEQVKALGANQTMAIAIAKALAEGKIELVPKILVAGGASVGTTEGVMAIIMGLLAEKGGLGAIFEAKKETAAKATTEVKTKISTEVVKEEKPTAEVEKPLEISKPEATEAKPGKEEPKKEPLKKDETEKGAGKATAKKEQKKY